MSRVYTVNEVFYSLQGEGMRAGTANVFVRFTGCNLRCALEPGDRSPGGFDCDTEFTAGRKVNAEELTAWMDKVRGAHSGPKNCILTGGEPGLQVDLMLLDWLRRQDWHIAIETNGSIALQHQLEDSPEIIPLIFNWVTVSPKVAEHAIRQVVADEVKYVRGYGQPLPKTVVVAKHKLISPAFNGTSLDGDTLKWCIDLCLQNPEWRLSPQMHKLWKVA